MSVRQAIREEKVAHNKHLKWPDNYLPIAYAYNWRQMNVQEWVWAKLLIEQAKKKTKIKQKDTK